MGLDFFQLRGKYPPPGKQFDQEGWCAGFKPVRAEFAFAKEQQQIEGVIDGGTTPVVAVVPAADFSSVQPAEFGGKHLVYILVGVTADSGKLLIQCDVVQIVQ